MKQIEIKEILKYIPHRYPFLLVDRILEYKKGESLVAIKNVTHNEPFFTGHFPGEPVMPGVLMVEALAQAAGILTYLTNDIVPTRKDWFFFAGIDNTRFKRVVTPGDQLTLKVTTEKVRKNFWKFNTQALVGDELACVSDIMIAKGA